MSVHELLSEPSTAGVWALVPDRSSIRFRARTLWGLVAVKGEFGDVRGDGQVTAKGAVFGHIDIRTASLRTGIGKRDEHLRSADFFDAERFPEISVVVTGLEPGGPGSGADAATLRGDLTVRGTTLPLELAATVRRLADGTVTVSAKGLIDRTKWGVTGNMAGMIPATTAVLADAVFVRTPE